MNCLKIELTPDEEKIFEFKMFHFQGLQIAMNQFLNTAEFEYNEDHYNSLMESYIEKNRQLTEYILELLKARGHTGTAVQGFNYEYTKGLLKLSLPQAMAK